MQQKGNDEFHLRELADRLQFKVDKVEDRFTLCRTSDVVQPVCEKDLTLSEAKEFFLNLEVAQFPWWLIFEVHWLDYNAAVPLP